MNNQMFSRKTIHKAFQNTLILKDETSLQILEDVCKEKNIPLPAFEELIIFAYKNRGRTMSGAKTVINDALEKME